MALHLWKLTVLSIGCAVSLQASLSIHVSEGRRYWKKLHFAKYWTFGDPSKFGDSQRLTFRAGPRQIFFAKEVSSFNAGPDEQPKYSLSQYVLELATGKVHLAKEAEWDAARQIASHVDSPFRKEPHTGGKGEISYAGRRFYAHPSAALLAHHALSPDGSWLAIMSYFGHLPEGIAPWGPTYGKLFVDIYRVSTGQRVAALRGFFGADDPGSSFSNASWLSDRHFLIPIDDGNGAWLCDLSPLDPDGDPVFDVLPSRAEILGFWEEPQILGYEDALEGMTIHTVVSVPKPGSYNITGQLVGFPRFQYAFGAEAIQAGTRALARTWNGAEVAGPFAFQNVRLLRGLDGDVLASAPDLGSTDSYRTTRNEASLRRWQERQATPHPAPAIVGVNPSRGIGPDSWFRISAKGLSDSYKVLDLLFNDHLDENTGCSISYKFSRQGSTERMRVSVSGDGRAAAVSEKQFQAGQRFWRENALEAEPVENGHCGLSGLWHEVEEVDMHVTFKPTFFGKKNIYARVSTVQGDSSGWKQIGTWLANEEQAPVPISVVPYLGSGIRQIFTFTASDINGASDIAATHVLIQSDRQPQNACAFTFSLPNNTISLVSDDGKPATNSFPVNTNPILQNAQCRISQPRIVAESHDSVQFRINIEFFRSFAGRRNVYADAEDKEHKSSSWQWLGSWRVSPQ